MMQIEIFTINNVIQHIKARYNEALWDADDLTYLQAN